MLKFEVYGAMRSPVKGCTSFGDTDIHTDQHVHVQSNMSLLLRRGHKYRQKDQAHVLCPKRYHSRALIESITSLNVVIDYFSHSCLKMCKIDMIHTRNAPLF